MVDEQKEDGHAVESKDKNLSNQGAGQGSNSNGTISSHKAEGGIDNTIQVNQTVAERENEYKKEEQIDGIPSINKEVPIGKIEKIASELSEAPISQAKIIESEAAISLDYLNAVLGSLSDEFMKRFDTLESLFKSRIIYDESKESQIRELHAELQSHKQGLLSSALKPFIKAMIRMHDNMSRSLNEIQLKILDKSESVTVEKMIEIFDNFKDELELILDQNGVESFTAEEATFNPRLQQVIRKDETCDVTKHGFITAHLRSGFRQNDVIIQKERVAIYVYKQQQNDQMSIENISPNKQTHKENSYEQ
jgi:molecular chaperone GrpE (heat shock protein)